MPKDTTTDSDVLRVPANTADGMKLWRKEKKEYEQQVEFWI